MAPDDLVFLEASYKMSALLPHYTVKSQSSKCSKINSWFRAEPRERTGHVVATRSDGCLRRSSCSASISLMPPQRWA
jgi:hypothetical protein